MSYDPRTGRQNFLFHSAMDIPSVWIKNAIARFVNEGRKGKIPDSQGSREGKSWSHASPQE